MCVCHEEEEIQMSFVQNRDEPYIPEIVSSQ